MDFVLFVAGAYVFTKISSKISEKIEHAANLRDFKDAADKGYIVDINERANIFGWARWGNFADFFFRKVPITNIAIALAESAAKYGERESRYQELADGQALIPMTSKELDEYKDSPTGEKALLISVTATLEKLEDAQRLVVFENQEYNEFYYKTNKQGRKKILLVNGAMEELSASEQADKLDCATYLLEERFKESFNKEELEELKEKILETSNVVLSIEIDQDIQEKTAMLSKEDREQNLKRFREAVLAAYFPENQKADEKIESFDKALSREEQIANLKSFKEELTTKEPEAKANTLKKKK